MSIETSFDRTITIVTRGVTSIERGREVVADGTTIPGVRALRTMADGTEDTDQRDEQTVTWNYLIQSRHPVTGALLDPTGFDRIIDGGIVMEIIGMPSPAVQHRRGRVHHVELKARAWPGAAATVGS